MTPDQKLDRWERLLRLLCERPLYFRHESRIQAAMLGDYVTALREYDAAKEALAVKPEDSEMNENVCKAKEILDRTREVLKGQIKTQPRRLPA